MPFSNLNDREIELLIVALRYWRRHRADGRTRETDPFVAPDATDLLLAKLSAVKASSTVQQDECGGINYSDREIC